MSETKVVSMAAHHMASDAAEPGTLMLLGVAPLPIEDAPVQPGVKFGPCLLYEPAPGHGGSNHTHLTGWFIGSWDGESWFLPSVGFIVSPTHWAPLPRDPD